MGVYEDPLVNFGKSLVKMAALLQALRLDQFVLPVELFQPRRQFLLDRVDRGLVVLVELVPAPFGPAITTMCGVKR